MKKKKSKKLLNAYALFMNYMEKKNGTECICFIHEINLKKKAKCN